MSATQQHRRVVLVTGCASGIGRALVPAFVERGCHVVATARRVEALAELAGPLVETLQLDVTDEARCHAVVREVVERHGRLDMLVNNAGFSSAGPLIEMPRDEILRHFEVLTLAPMLLARAAAAPMIEARRGVIVNIGSVNALICGPFSGPYGAAKAALHTLSNVLRMELWPWRIDVVAVHAGGVRTNIRKPLHATLDAQLSNESAYRPELAAMHTAIPTIDRNWISAEAFARKLVPRLLKRRPPRTIRLGTYAWLAPLLHSLLPQSWQEHLLRRTFKFRRRD